MGPSRDEASRRLAGSASAITADARNEANPRAELEKALERACGERDIIWTPYRIERSDRRVRFVSVAHGAVIIEYEPPCSFDAGNAHAAVDRARARAEEYADLLSVEEGRAVGDYVLVAWDGAHISFGRRSLDGCTWETVTPFGETSARRLLDHLAADGTPLVHPRLLSQLLGPGSELGARLLPGLFEAVVRAAGAATTTTQTELLYTEWRRLFGQVNGVQSERLRSLLTERGRAHGAAYADDVPAYLFALNTYIALVAKLVAAMALPDASRDVTDPGSTIAERVGALEDGAIFVDAGIENMLNGDFFAWYRDDAAWASYADAIEDLVDTLRSISFDLSAKDPASTRDLFKGMYMEFVPAALRHALGEYYTPDWLAAHALDELGWDVDDGIGDPTCGSGTFVLEALRRRLAAAPADADAHRLLYGVWGLDLNPLAVLAARASIVVLLADRLDPARPVRLPIHLADAIDPAERDGSTYHHALLTEKGEVSFRIPRTLVEGDGFFAIMNRTRDLVTADLGACDVYATLAAEFHLDDLAEDERGALSDTLHTLVALHADDWDGIWCTILAERFAAGAIPPGPYVAGNPPWVKWSHLPSRYAERIKARCLELGVFSEDVWVGGIESDISTVITYEAVEKYLAPGGTLGFLITGTVFANASSQGFRRWRLGTTDTSMKVTSVEDYSAVEPFEGVSNHATLLIVERGEQTTYPVRYRVWSPPRDPADARRPQRRFASAADFRNQAHHVDLEARPVPGTDAGPWLKGTAAQHALWSHVFSDAQPAFKARKGVTTDANGIFFVRVSASGVAGEPYIQNEPTLGRRPIGKVRRRVEDEHLFPLLRGEGVAAFRATPDPQFRLVLPQRGMHGDPDLPSSAPRTHRWLREFRGTLQERSSYRRFQRRAGAPWWSLWSIGPYTFAPYKVVWREMGGGAFAAAYVGSHADEILGTKLVIPDHKVYFVPCETEREAAYLTGFLNAPTVAAAISAYAAQLSLGVSVVEYVDVPAFEPGQRSHAELASRAAAITARGGADGADLHALDALVADIVDLPTEVLASARPGGPTGGPG